MRNNARQIMLGTAGELQMHGLTLPGIEGKDPASLVCLPVDAALKLLMRILETLWKLDRETQAKLLKVSLSTLARYRRGVVPRKREQIDRIEDLLRCYQALRVLLPRADAADAWPTCSNARFRPNPVAYMLRHGTKLVRQYLEAETA